MSERTGGRSGAGVRAGGEFIIFGTFSISENASTYNGPLLRRPSKRKRCVPIVKSRKAGSEHSIRNRESAGYHFKAHPKTDIISKSQSIFEASEGKPSVRGQAMFVVVSEASSSSSGLSRGVER